MYSRKGLGKPFLYSEETLKILPQTILKNSRTSRATPSGNSKSTYKGSFLRAGSIAALGAIFAGSVALIYPVSTSASWPFRSAQAADEETPVLHDPSIRLLAAAINTDPDPSKFAGEISVSDGSALMASVGPEGEISTHSDEASTSHSGSGKISVYTVEEGDSISGIASDHGVSVNTILWANDLTIRSTITPGMDLVILPVSGAKHKVASGETLSTIAKKYQASASEIATFNGLDASATVVVGSTLIIPKGEVVSTGSMAKKTTKTTTKTTATPSKTITKTTTVKTSADLGTASASDGYFTNPVPGAVLYQSIHGNNGVDLSAPNGTPIHAAAEGTVIVSKADGGWNGGYGSYVVISHGNGAQTLYAHMSQDIVSVGDSVSSGQLIGYVGNTGQATGDHLHFEVRGAKNWLGSTCKAMSKCY